MKVIKEGMEMMRWKSKEWKGGKGLEKKVAKKEKYERLRKPRDDKKWRKKVPRKE